MELVMGGLLIGVSGMLVLLIVAAWKDPPRGRLKPIRATGEHERADNFPRYFSKAMIHGRRHEGRSA